MTLSKNHYIRIKSKQNQKIKGSTKDVSKTVK